MSRTEVAGLQARKGLFLGTWTGIFFLGFRYFLDDLEEGVVFFFVYYCRVFAVAGEYQVVVGEWKYFLLDAKDQCLVVAAGKVGAAYAALEECVASDDGLLFGGGIADAARTMSGAVETIDVDVADGEFVTIVDKDGAEVLHVVDREAHNAAIGFGLTQQFYAVGVHGDGEFVAFCGLTQSADMVDMSVGEQNHCRGELFAADELVELCVLIGGFHARVDDGALA